MYFSLDLYSSFMHIYLGRTTLTSKYFLSKHLGREPTTSANPPVLIKGTHSEAINNTFLDVYKRQGHPNPTEAILKRYMELGGEILTIGCDGHAPEQLAWDFEKIPALLKECGFRYYTVFEERMPVFYPVETF